VQIAKEMTFEGDAKISINTNDPCRLSGSTHTHTHTHTHTEREREREREREEREREKRPAHACKCTFPSKRQRRWASLC